LTIENGKEIAGVKENETPHIRRGPDCLQLRDEPFGRHRETLMLKMEGVRKHEETSS
jgi:hypothetical protein